MVSWEGAFFWFSSSNTNPAKSLLLACIRLSLAGITGFAGIAGANAFLSIF